MKQENKMTVEIWSDVMCPFCYIGKRRFEKALANFKHKDAIQVVWKSFQLNPNMVTNPSISATQHLATSKGWTLEQTKEMQSHVTNMAADAGLQFNFDKAVVANSFNAHRLLQFAKTKKLGDALKEILLRSYFVEGKNTDDNVVLLEIGVAAGLDKNDVENILKDKNAFAEAVQNDVAEAQQLGISGVPFFVIDRKYGISGAQESATFGQALEKSFAEFTEKQQKEMQFTTGDVCTPDGTC